MRESGLFLLVILVIASSMMLELHKNGQIVMKLWGHHKMLFERAAIPAPLMSFWKTIAGNVSAFSRRVCKSIRALEDNVLRVDIGRLTMTKCEYIQIREMMERWNVSIGELCRYSIMSVIKAHD